MKTNAKYWIETFRSEAGHPVNRHYWRIVSRNGQILATSEGYKRAASRNKIAARLSLVHGFEVRKGLP